MSIRNRSEGNASERSQACCAKEQPSLNEILQIGMARLTLDDRVSTASSSPSKLLVPSLATPKNALLPRTGDVGVRPSTNYEAWSKQVGVLIKKIDGATIYTGTNADLAKFLKNVLKASEIMVEEYAPRDIYAYHAREACYYILFFVSNSLNCLKNDVDPEIAWKTKMISGQMPTAIGKYMKQVDQNAMMNLPSYIYVEPLYRIYEFADRTMFRGFELISGTNTLDGSYYESHDMVTDIILPYQQKYALPRITLHNSFEFESIGNRDNKVSTSEYSVQYDEGMFYAANPKNKLRDVSDHYYYNKYKAKLVLKQQQPITENEAADILKSMAEAMPPPCDDA